jgi:hypothetical protein
MAGAFDNREFLRLEDIIALAWQGKEVRLSIELKKPIIIPKFLPGEIEGMKEGIDMYLLVANYSFHAEKEVGKVSKIYGSGIVTETQDVAKQNSILANRRLDIDYKRLEISHIKFDKKYWE